jgi:hypothetical protein
MNHRLDPGKPTSLLIRDTIDAEHPANALALVAFLLPTPHKNLRDRIHDVTRRHGAVGS